MSSSEYLETIETPTFRSSFADSWISEAFSRDTQALTTALQNSISDNSLVNPGSDPEPENKRHRIADPPLTGRVSKRKPRASKRTQTTVIAADPANFRQMVQQVTGFRFDGGQMSVSPILKPEPQRPGSRLYNGTGPGILPMLDTSASLVDHQQPYSGTYPSFPTVVESWNV